MWIGFRALFLQGFLNFLVLTKQDYLLTMNNHYAGPKDGQDEVESSEAEETPSEETPGAGELVD